VIVTVTNQLRTVVDIFTDAEIIKFRVRHSQSEMYSDHGRLCVCLSLAAFLHYCTDAGVTWGNGWGAL